jgi:HAD superfamily hydrolase (TIGR01509 family)
VAKCWRSDTGRTSSPSAASAPCFASDLSAFELVIFDCDGVLVDSERISTRIDVEVLAELGWPITQDEVIERFVGKTDAAMRQEVEEYLGRPLTEEWDGFASRYSDAFAAELAPVDGVVDALDQIDAPTCVASSGTPQSIELKLRLTGLWERFEGRIFSAADVEHGKPAPDLFLHAAAQMGVDPAACAVIEDSPFGVQAADAAGMRSFGYAGGIMSPERLRSADVVFDDMRELPGLLGFSRRRDGSP